MLFMIVPVVDNDIMVAAIINFIYLLSLLMTNVHVINKLMMLITGCYDICKRFKALHLMSICTHMTKNRYN